ncbi:hypothetical protein KKF17_02450 [Patescibacteria group bacterium]|nr:hypothetical protein [Patescibacteria group bacterium]
MKKINFVLKEFFYILTSVLVIFSLLELAWPGVVLSYININWLLIFWLIIGIVMLLFKKNYDL